MIQTILKKLLQYLPGRVNSVLLHWRAKIFDLNTLKSYSQEGEDMISKKIFEGERKGFYVDVEAHHPSRFLNTNVFYKLGWDGEIL